MMDRFHKAMVLGLIVLSISFGWQVYAIPAPSRSSVITPGGESVPCTYTAYVDGLNYLLKNCHTGDNDYSSTDAWTILQTGIFNIANLTGGIGGILFLQAGIYNILTNTLKITGNA